jgi:hypothetical protein
LPKKLRQLICGLGGFTPQLPLQFPAAVDHVIEVM